VRSFIRLAVHDDPVHQVDSLRVAREAVHRAERGEEGVLHRVARILFDR